MTAFISYFDQNNVVLSMDTLVTTPEGKPAYFASKATYVAHIRSLIAGTGIAGFSNDWAKKVSCKMVLQNILNLDYHTPENLRARWANLCKIHPEVAEQSTTVYQWGYDSQTDKLWGFAYRSTNDFVSEELSAGWRFKPECDAASSDDVLLCLPTMMRQQREIQDTRPISERVHIGGECVTFILNRDGCTTIPLFEFPDFEMMQNDIFSNYKSLWD